MQFPTLSILQDTMATTQPIFRMIEIAEGLELTLDRTIPENVMPYMQPVGGIRTRMMVKPGFVKNAQSVIANLLTENGPIQSMDFTYDPGTDYQDLVDRYSEPLGPPTSSGPGQTSTWQDDQTRFTLTAQGSGSSSIVTSTLQDA
jgi:hypothetical protein